MGGGRVQVLAGQTRRSWCLRGASRKGGTGALKILRQKEQHFKGPEARVGSEDQQGGQFPWSGVNQGVVGEEVSEAIGGWRSGSPGPSWSL